MKECHKDPEHRLVDYIVLVERNATIVTVDEKFETRMVLWKKFKM
jgi:PIN domain nuclease of toxin-antitoxin system